MAMMPRKEMLPGSQSKEAEFTVKELLNIPLLKEARLLAGNKGVQKAIKRVNVMEVPDVISWVRPGEFLMTTGYPFRDEPERLQQLVPELAKRGVAAFGIMKKRYSDELPPEVVAEAEKHGLPLLELPSDIVFSDLVRIVMERVLAQETSQLADLQNRIQSMTRLLLEGSGLYSFLDAMEDMLDNPVAVVRENDKPWLSKSLRSAEPTEVWPLLQSLTFRQVGRGSSNGFMLLQNSYRVYASQIPTRRMKQACLVLVERNRDILPIDVLSVDRLSSLAGLELANVEAVREVEGKYLDQFLQDWLSGKIVSEADWKLRADVCGCAIPEGTPMCALLVGWQTPEPSEKLREIARRLRSERLRSVDGLLAAPIGDDLALVLPIGHLSQAGADREEACSQLIGRLLSELRSLLGERELKLFSGRIVERSDGLQGSWAQAKRARQVAEVCRLPGEIVSYDRLGVYSLLYLIPSGEEREQFLNRFSAPLLQADRKGGGRLVETLEMFFRCNGNIKLTSERLYAHYNTIVYRLEKVQSILGVSLDDPEDRLQLHLALKLGQITPGSSG
ncbi:PucR family transcriptional regulator [Cohnella luojiensis]|uniref:PucR family transcriptional regulator n=1 Tax=Cohnella luojiensis TaxID=652876 RepID=A0A4Y8M4I4_9BACL|nr:PucR family transcriptional regulator [Cohnella luojiensis]TFE29859.1 PucR family transcriptional regulator [Cohnella luojiensis]